MSELPPPGPALPAPPPPPPVPEVRPRSRTWFVVLSWITLIAFGIFVAGITAVTAALPQIKKAREASR